MTEISLTQNIEGGQQSQVAPSIEFDSPEIQVTIDDNTITHIYFTAQNITVNTTYNPSPTLNTEVKLVYVLCDVTIDPFTRTEIGFKETTSLGNLKIEDMSLTTFTSINLNYDVSSLNLKNYKPGVIIRNQDDDEVLGFFVMKTDMKNNTTTSHPVHYIYTDLSQNTQFSQSGMFCLLKGTLILTPQGYKPIESLSRGDEIYNSSKKVKKIKSVLYQKVKVDKSKKKRDKCMDKYKLKGNNDLIVSGGHMVKLDDGYHLPIYSDRFENVQEDKGENEYYNLELDDYDYFIADGIEVESLCKNDSVKHTYYKERGLEYHELIKSK